MNDAIGINNSRSYPQFLNEGKSAEKDPEKSDQEKNGLLRSRKALKTCFVVVGLSISIVGK